MLNATDTMKEFVEAHKTEIRDAMWARLEDEFDAEEIADQVLSNFDIPEMLAELITLRF